MRILILTHSFNSLAQKVYAELKRKGHTLTVEYDISDQVTESAVKNFKPDLIIAPFLKRPIPESVWRHVITLIIHPGPPGNRGPSSLDWAILNQEKYWGVTIIEANNIMDGGDVWASQIFSLSKGKKGTIYRRELANAALLALLEAIAHLEDFKKGKWLPTSSSNYTVDSQPMMRQINRSIDWQNDSLKDVFKKINSSDGSPGVLSVFDNKKFYLYDVCKFPTNRPGPLGVPLAICDHGLVVNTKDGTITIGHLKEKSTKGNPSFKVAAKYFFKHLDFLTFPRVRTEIHHNISWIYFNFYNGAMGIKECEDLHCAYLTALKSSTKIIVLKSESDFFSNGIHLNEIEAAQVPADYAWNNINIMNDLISSIITATDKVTIAILEDNVSAGGVLLARANDFVISFPHVILNPHYKNMGNLYGSEFWSYLFPYYLGEDSTKKMMNNRLPMEVEEARELGLIDQICKSEKIPEILKAIEEKFDSVVKQKKIIREQDEAIKPLIQYREEELLMMKQNFYGSDVSFHLARYNFVRHIVKSKTPLYLAIHRSSQSNHT